MCPGFLNLALLLSLCGTLAVAMLEIESGSGEDAFLPCTAVYTPGVQYIAVRWYKVSEPPSPYPRSGLLTKDLLNGTTLWFKGLQREVSLLGETNNILLPNVSCEDSGVYRCHLAAPVGEQNQDGEVLLSLTDCSDSSTQRQTTDACLTVLAIVLLLFSFALFLISYKSLESLLRGRNRTTEKAALSESPFKPLDKKDLMLLYTLGPKTTTATMKHIWV